MIGSPILRRGPTRSEFSTEQALLAALKPLIPGGNATVTLTDAATIAVNAALGSRFKVTPTANRAFGNPTNPTDGQKIAIMITIGGAGTLALTFGSAYIGGATVSLSTLVTALALLAAGAKARVEFEYDAVLTKWVLINYQTTIA